MYTIIDIETTGNGIKGNRITEISIFKFDGEKVIDEFTSLVNPQCPIPYFITGLTGIDDQMVAHAPTFNEIADKITEITQDCIFVAHAVNFDYGVIKEEFRQLGINFARKKLCTVRLSRKLIPGLRSYSLGKLCSALNITITDRHRARGDAQATVVLFQSLLQKPNANKAVSNFLNARSQEATLPPHLDRNVLTNIPNKPGIYYFRDQKGIIIYVGKAKNLKKRVLGHFYDKSEHEIRLCKEIANIEFELSGGELLALLMESSAIKKHWPKYNRAQKRRIKRFGIYSYENRKGILHLGFAPLKQHNSVLAIFSNPTECREFLLNLCDEFNLCPKYCQLLGTATVDNFSSYCNCKGICQENESIEDYNKKVIRAIDSINHNTGDILLPQNGRNTNEKAFIWMKDGVYQGYGFVPNDVAVASEEDFEAFLIRQRNTVETEAIIKSALIKTYTVG